MCAFQPEQHLAGYASCDHDVHERTHAMFNMQLHPPDFLGSAWPSGTTMQTFSDPTLISDSLCLIWEVFSHQITKHD